MHYALVSAKAQMHLNTIHHEVSRSSLWECKSWTPPDLQTHNLTTMPGALAAISPVTRLSAEPAFLGSEPVGLAPCL
uniref:Uncharacterized protein n=1 Tax=Arundo donax TaxID=35708 RepID=A0A0A9G2R8_ARUDO